jgi:hypothetical protein
MGIAWVNGKLSCKVSKRYRQGCLITLPFYYPCTSGRALNLLPYQLKYFLARLRVDQPPEIKRAETVRYEIVRITYKTRLPMGKKELKNIS